MQITVALPVLFKGKALRGDGMRTMLTFVPTNFEIAEIEEIDAPLVATLYKPLESKVSQYRSFDNALYGALASSKPRGPDTGDEIVRRIHQAVAGLIAPVVEATRVDELYPKDARELVGLVFKHDGYEEYLERIQDRLAARNMGAATADNPDYYRGYNASLEVASREAARFFLVDGQRYQHTAGLNIKVEWHYNNTVKVTEEEPWSGSLWQQKPGEVSRNSSYQRSRYFSIADRDGALAYAEEVGASLGQQVVNRLGAFCFHEPVEFLPSMNWSYAEVVRSATYVCHVVGTELARRTRNQEKSIFTDDPTLRYAFDRLLDTLRDIDPFGEPDDRIEVEATRLLSVIDGNSTEIDARYRNLASEHTPCFDHLKTSLERFEDREVEVVIGNRQALGR